MSKELLFSVTIKDCDVQTFRAGGKGGQHQNKTESAVRVIHRPSGAVGECREHREQPRNKKVAFSRMANSPEFQSWAKRRGAEMSGNMAKVEEKVDHELRFNTKVEYVENGEWVES